MRTPLAHPLAASLPLPTPPQALRAPRRRAACAMGALSPQISLLLALGGATMGILVVLVYCVYECPGINTTTGDYQSRRRLLEAFMEQ
jgi:hypothetical protein